MKARIAVPLAFMAALACGRAGETPAPTLTSETTGPATALAASPSPSAPPASTATSLPAPTATPILVTPGTTEVVYTSGDLQLKGFLCVPTGAPPFPAVIYNHGGIGADIGGAPRETCQALAQGGFVGFSPIRRQTPALAGHLDDVLAAVDYVKALLYVDARRTAITGFSRGGFLTYQVAVARPADFRAIVIMAPAVEILQGYLAQAGSVSAPVLLLVAQNDRTPHDHVQSTRELEAALLAAGKDVKLIVYPPYGSDGHQMFFEVGDYWMDVQGFLKAELAATPADQHQVVKDQTYVTTSSDGLTWSQATLLAEKASVPEVIYTSQGVYWAYWVDFSDASGPGTEDIGVARSTDGVHWEKLGLVDFGDIGAIVPVDPDVMELPDGRLRMYFYDISQTQGEHPIYSAVSSDGIHFAPEPGVRLALENIFDPNVVQLPDGSYRMFLNMTDIISASSSDGLTFTKDDGIRVEKGAVPGAIVLPDGALRLYACVQGISVYKSTEGLDFSLEKQSVITAAGGGIVCDPSVTATPNGYVMVYKFNPGK